MVEKVSPRGLGTQCGTSSVWWIFSTQAHLAPSQRQHKPNYGCATNKRVGLRVAYLFNSYCSYQDLLGLAC